MKAMSHHLHEGGCNDVSMHLINFVSLTATSLYTSEPVIQMPVLLERQIQSEPDIQMPQGNLRKMDVEGGISFDVFCVNVVQCIYIYTVGGSHS